MKKTINASPLAKRQLIKLGGNLRMARLRRDLSMRDVALRAGISVNTLVAAEAGEPGVSIGAIANILHTLNLSDDISRVAKDDILGRKLQDLELEPKKKATKKPAATELSNLIRNSK